MDSHEFSHSQEPTLTYSEVMDYILQGKQIPGVKDIPDTTLGLEAGSEAKQPTRKKPWEIKQFDASEIPAPTDGSCDFEYHQEMVE